MTLQVRRITATNPDPTKIAGVTFMLSFNQSNITREQILGIEKNGNNFEVMYIHDTNMEGFTYISGLIFLDENSNIGLAGDVCSIGRRYIGKFDLGGVAKHVLIQL